MSDQEWKNMQARVGFMRELNALKSHPATGVGVERQQRKIERIELALSALRAQEQNEPLTLGEVGDRIDNPVFFIPRNTKELSQWVIVSAIITNLYSGESVVAVRGRIKPSQNDIKYPYDGTFYAHEPQHADAKGEPHD